MKTPLEEKENELARLKVSVKLLEKVIARMKDGEVVSYEEEMEMFYREVLGELSELDNET